MLSRVAERLYWTGRYLERAEDTARIINVHTNLLLDLPKGTTFGWGALVAIFGNAEAYAGMHAESDEHSAMRFMLAEHGNPSSILSSLHQARENLRTSRDVVPREAWERLNQLYQYAKLQGEHGIARHARYEFLTRVIDGCQLITGLFSGTMSRDQAYDFLRIGRNLERADMTSRIIDVRSANLLVDHTAGLTPFATIQWMSVLKSLSAYQMYRRHVHVRVRGPEVLSFLLKDPHFPRSVLHSLGEVQQSLGNLVRNEVPRRHAIRLKRQLHHVDIQDLIREGLHEFIDRLQIGLGRLHERIQMTYFLNRAQAPRASSIAA